MSTTLFALQETLPHLHMSLPHMGIRFHMDGGATTVPDPPAKPLPGKLESGGSLIVSWLKRLMLFAAAAGFSFIGICMILGMRGRSNFAKDALSHTPIILTGAIIAGAGGTALQYFT